MGELWYQNVAYEDKKELVKENLANTVTSFIAAGYWLKDIRDSKGYLKDGYQSVWECAEAEFGLKVSEASRAMSMNDKYSIDGNTPFMNDTYKEYNKSQLQEMLTLSDEQMEQVTPDMTVTAIRKMKNPVPEQTKEQQEKLDSWVKAFVADEYMNLLRFYNMAAGFGVEQLKDEYTEGMQVSDCVLLLGDADSELIDEETGEIVGKYSSQTVVNVLTACFLESRQQKSEKMLPEIKGLMDDPYCRACGCPLNSPDDGCQSTICPECGQAVDWSKWIKSCDIATDSVMTECEGEFEDEIITDIEVLPEQEESLSIEFDTEELERELDAVIDAEYREVPQALSAYGLPKTEYPEDSLIATEGCGHKHNCYSCSKECDIRGEERYCVEAPMGNPFSCTTMNVLENLEDEFAGECQFINTELAEHRAGDGEPVPCCKKCNVFDCGYRCRRATNLGLEQKEEVVESESESQGELPAIKQLLDAKKKELNDYLSVDGIPENTIFEKKTVVAALANMVCELEDLEETEEEKEVLQPELPKFKNNDERKAWLGDVEAWGLWYEDHNIQARYYKYDFVDGSRLIAVKYRYSCPSWLKDDKQYSADDGSYKNVYYHMIYGEEYKKAHKYEYEKYYTHSTTSVSVLVEFLKEIAKKVNKSE